MHSWSDIVKAVCQVFVLLGVVVLVVRLLVAPLLQQVTANDPLLSSWGATEFFTLTGFSITLVGVILALQSLRATQESAHEAAESSRELLRHEQSARMEIPYHPGNYADEIPEGAYLWITNQVARPGVAIVRGRIRNIGRFGARDVALHVARRNESLPKLMDVPTYLEADSHAYEFEFELPLGDVDTSGDLTQVIAEFDSQ